MKRKEQDSFSTTSATSARKSAEPKKKPRRFSLRRFFSRGSLGSTKAVRAVRTNSEVETRSVSSLQTSSQSDRDSSSPNPGEEAVHKHGKLKRETLECPLCLSQQSIEHFPLIMTCHHRSCRDCLKQYLKIEITESRINIACPECAEKFHPNDIRYILSDNSLMQKYEDFMLRRVLVADPDTRWCPAPDCGYAVIASGCASCPKLKCDRPGCDTQFCYHCKQYWHPNQTCDAARAERAANMRSSSLSYSQDSSSQSKLPNDIKPCPRCSALIVKMDDGSCNHMTCAVCGAEFCWLCMKEISDLHYLSPSGCTFWGKKPWSRKKKILWQLGTLVGAPVGISLIAGIAVPAMIIGIPVWVGRKLHAKYEHKQKHRRNLIIAGGVSASILVSPIMAGLAVGIGVPILLAYVYGVVPISLCRSGGCGVSTTDSGGVRFEFDDDNDVTVGVSSPYPGGDAQSVETTSHHVANPSIGPSIGEMSVGMTNSLSASGSHMERVGLIRDESDRDSASHRALAGASLNGSLCGSMAGPSCFTNKLEVQADVSNNPPFHKRSSLSSESANFSLDAKSATVSFGDDASTRALAGSICTRDKDNASVVISSYDAVQLDVGSASARFRHESGNVHAEAASQHKAGSPTSTRSVNFMDEDTVISHSGKTKRFKRQSLSVGDCINEHSDRNIERLSVRSLTEDEAIIDSPGQEKDTDQILKQQCRPYTVSSSGSTSIESMLSHPGILVGATGGTSTLPEVESDKPEVMCYIDKCILGSSSSESSTDTVGAIRSGGLLHHNHGLDLDDEDIIVGKPSRRRSCELAMQEGRLVLKFS